MAKPSPIYINRFITGLSTNRSPLVTPYTFSGLTRVDRIDALIDGVNVEVTNQATLKRRPGFSKHSTAALGGSDIPRDFYSFRDSVGTIRVVSDLTSRFVEVTPSAVNTIVSLSGGVLSFQGVGDTLYFANGSIAKKWDGTTASNIGIAAGVTPPGIGLSAGALTALFGYQYVYAFANSSTGHISSASPASANTGPFASKNLTITGANATDSQVDQVRIYRTKDGGSTYYFVASITYTPGWSYIDSTVDASLDVQETAPLGNVNDPPPTGITNLTFHMGRLWGSVGNIVYYATGPDALVGVPEEAWNPINFFSFPGQVTALVPTQSGLLVFTVDDLYIIRGTDASTFYPQLWLAGFGVQSRLSVDKDGERILIYTSNQQLFSLTSSGYEEIGFAVADLLAASFPSASSMLTVYRSGSNESSLFITNNAGNFLRYSLNLEAWSPKASPIEGQGALRAVETSPGVTKLLRGSNSASKWIYYRDPTTFTDNGFTMQTPFVTFGQVNLSTPGVLATLDFIALERKSAGSQPTVSLLPDEISGTFTALTGVADPPELGQSTSIPGMRYYLKTAATPLPELMRHLQVKVTFPDENAAHEILSLTLVPR